MRRWISAFRLQTLPLAFACIISGAGIGVLAGIQNWTLLFLALLTATCLQILSNLANDYGDAISGVDNSDRLGPERAVQSGEISVGAMKKAVFLFSTLSLIAGLTLLKIAFNQISLQFILFFVLGVAAIAAAIKYTIGKNAYGYSGLGDISVFVFFGLVGVLGASYLFAGEFNLESVFLSISIGCFSVGVLNLNNLRDIENDAKFGKNTLVVKRGKPWGIVYHYALIGFGWLSYLVFFISQSLNLYFLIPFLTVPLFISNVQAVKNHTNPKELIPKLKQLALGTFVFSILLFCATLLS